MTEDDIVDDIFKWSPGTSNLLTKLVQRTDPNLNHWGDGTTDSALTKCYLCGTYIINYDHERNELKSHVISHLKEKNLLAFI